MVPATPSCFGCALASCSLSPNAVAAAAAAAITQVVFAAATPGEGALRKEGSAYPREDNLKTWTARYNSQQALTRPGCSFGWRVQAAFTAIPCFIQLCCLLWLRFERQGFAFHATLTSLVRNYMFSHIGSAFAYVLLFGVNALLCAVRRPSLCMSPFGASVDPWLAKDTAVFARFPVRVKGAPLWLGGDANTRKGC